MRKILVCAGVLALASVVVPGTGARAEDTGLAGMHGWVRVGGRTCMADHYHDGSGTGRTRASAQAAAIRAWVDFTAWEYGRAWGSYSAAVSKSMSCSGGGSNWSCSTSARPCRYR
ncbi:MAG TPA: hypothetical protein VJ233_09735 [Hyphomicrobiaceae bacterium]|nr:hypothetical protein [Hyphomicrobiaceae bacterium]